MEELIKDDLVLMDFTLTDGDELESVGQIQDRMIPFESNAAQIFEWNKLKAIQMGQSISKRKRMQRGLRKTFELHSNLLAKSPNPIIVTNPDASVNYVNPALEDLTGFSSAELLGSKPPYPWCTEETMQKTGRDMEKGICEAVFQKKSGERFWIEITTTPIRTDSEYTYYLSNWVDITERKRAEEQIRTSLREKEVLLKDIHHRVKNNMQIILSLLRLQSEHVNDKSDLELFNDCQSRVMSMTLVHKTLYQSGNLAEVDFADYIQSLAGHLFHAYNVSVATPKLSIDIKDVSLGIGAAIPCGLIITELVSNSLKYAFTEGTRGEIKIAMQPIKENEIELVVSDDGIGLPNDFDFLDSESLGLQLVVALVQQLKGTIELDRSSGTEFKIHFLHHP